MKETEREKEKGRYFSIIEYYTWHSYHSHYLITYQLALALGKSLILIPKIVGIVAFVIGNSSFTTHIKDFPCRINILELPEVVGSCLRILSSIPGIIEFKTTVLWRSVKLSFVHY